MDVVRRAGFDTTKDPIDLDYIIMPPPIAECVSNIDLIDSSALERRAAHRIREIIAAARADFARDQGDL